MFFKELTLLIVSVTYAILRGSARTCGEPRKVIVWQMAKLGDMVCTTPMFRALKQAYPDIHVTVVGNAINKSILEGNMDVDEYIVFNGLSSILSLVRKGNYDVGFITAPSVIALAILFLGKVRCIAAPHIENGYSPYETSIYRTLLSLASTHPHRMGSYAPREYLRLLECVGIHTENTTKHLAYSDDARKKVKVFLQEHNLKEKKFTVISPSAGNKIKRWPSERFARVAEYIVSQEIPVVVIGGSRDREEVWDMMRAVERPQGIVNALERFSIDELKALIAQAGLFIAVDTGPVYIAEAFGIPTVDIAGPMDENEQPPRGERHIVVVPPSPRTPQLHIMNARVYDKGEAYRQVESVTPSMVIEACEKLISQ